ncbi:MAG: hypothetical protein IPM13_10305 [Phycisphaerales bacterium]|nr:hypothetical protein [Phycisphaerales bacterium]
MKTFTDNAGRTWTLAINVGAVKRVRDLLGVDLLSVFESDLIERLYRDPVLLCDVIYTVCRPEADALGISDEDFGRAMAGDAIDHATQALLAEVVSFFPSPRDRANLQALLTKAQAVMDRARDKVEAAVLAIDPGRLVDQMLGPSGGSSGAAPASSASNPTD